MTKQPTTDSHIKWFRDAAPYINAHRGRTFVIEFGGEAVADQSFDTLISDLALLYSLGIKLVLVHGARPQIETQLKQHNVESQYHEGLRVTDQASLPLVMQAAGAVRLEIEAALSKGLVNTPMDGSRVKVASGNFVTAKPIGIRDGIDLCHTGTVRKIEHSAIQALLDANNIVLLSPLGFSATGEVFNLHAEEVATLAATALNADKLIFMMDGEQLPSTDHQARELNASQAQALLDRDPELPEPLRLDLQSAIAACQQGVKRVHLINNTRSGALLQELFTRDGVGTLVTTGRYEDLRPADINDVGGILQLIAPLENNGTLSRRSREQLELEIGNFIVNERDGMIVGCAALYPYPEDSCGELACVVVHPDYNQQGRGDELLSIIEEQAKKLGLKSLFVLTTQTEHWFREKGYNPVDTSTLPEQKRSLYNYQRNSKVFSKTL